MSNSKASSAQTQVYDLGTHVQNPDVKPSGKWKSDGTSIQSDKALDRLRALTGRAINDTHTRHVLAGISDDEILKRWPKGSAYVTNTNPLRLVFRDSVGSFWMLIPRT